MRNLLNHILDYRVGTWRAMIVTFLIRLVYGYLYGLDYLNPNPAAASYFMWTIVLCIVVGLLFGPSSRDTKE